MAGEGGNWKELPPASAYAAVLTCGTTLYRVSSEYDLPMTEAAERFLRSFKALPKPDQHDVLVSLLRLPLEADYLAPSDDELTHVAEQVFLAFDQAEQSQ